MSNLNKRWVTSNEMNRFGEIIKNTSSESTSYDKSERTRFSAGGFGVDAPNWKIGLGLVATLLGGVGVFELGKSLLKKSEDNNQSANKIKEDTASTDNDIRYCNAKHGHNIELQKLKHEQWIEKEKIKTVKTGIISTETSSHPLLAPTNTGPVSHSYNYFSSEEVVQPQALDGELIFNNEITIIFSPTNVGKTFFATHLCAKICERNTNMQGIYYNTEMNDSQMKRILFGNKDGEEWPRYSDNIEVISEIHTTDELVNNMAMNIEKYKKDLAIFIDNSTYFEPSSRSEKSTEFLKLLKRILTQAKNLYGINIAFIVICHTNKIERDARLDLNVLKGNGNLNNFADRVIAIGRVPEHNNMRYIKVLKSRTGNIDEKLRIYRTSGNPRFIYIGDAKEDDVLDGRYREPKETISEDLGKKWYQEKLAGKGYGTIAREHFKLPAVDKNDTDEIKKEKQKRFEKNKGIVKYQIKKYKEKLVAQSA